MGDQNDWFYWIYWIFSTFHLFNLLVGGPNWNFSTFRPLAERSVWLILLNIDFLTLRPLAGRSKWSILLNTVPFILSPHPPKSHLPFFSAEIGFLSKWHVKSPPLLLYGKMCEPSKPHFTGFIKKNIWHVKSPPFFSEFSGVSKNGFLSPPPLVYPKRVLKGGGLSMKARV